VAGIIGIPGRLQLEWVAAFARNPRATSSECAAVGAPHRRMALKSGPPAVGRASTRDSEAPAGEADISSSS
jgi:hypothetical protein